MDASTRAISPLRQRMIDDMRMRKLAEKTQSPYIRAVRRLAAFLGRSPDTATVEDLRRYQLHLVDHGTSPISLNATITGLKFFFEVTLDRRRTDRQDAAGAGAAQTAGGIEPGGGCAPDRGGRQPEAPDGAIGGLRRRTARQRGGRAEGRRHRQSAHDACASSRARASKDRYAMLPPVLLERLRAWWRVARAQGKMLEGGWLFPGLNPIESLSCAAAQPGGARGGAGGRHRQAGVDAHAAAQLRHAPAGAEGRHPRHPGAARAQEDWRPRPSMRRWPPTCCAK